jgi:hypothetical protein
VVLGLGCLLADRGALLHRATAPPRSDMRAPARQIQRFFRASVRTHDPGAGLTGGSHRPGRVLAIG